MTRGGPFRSVTLAFVALVAILALAVLVLSACEGGNGTNNNTGVDGRVVEAGTQNGIGGAVVTLDGTQGTTNDDPQQGPVGNFSIRGIAPGTYDIEVDAIGFEHFPCPGQPGFQVTVVDGQITNITLTPIEMVRTGNCPPPGP